MLFTSYVLLIFTLFYNQGDQSSIQQINKINFPIDQNLTAQAIKVPPEIYAKIPGFVISDSFLVMMRMYTEPLFLVFELPDCKYLGGFGSLGRGPDEFELPDSRNGIATEKGFLIYDVRKGLYHIDLSKSILNNRPITNKRIKLPGELFLINDLIQLNDSIIVGYPYPDKSDKPYVKYNFKSNKIEYFGEFPTIFPKSKKEHFWPIFWRHSVAKPDGKKFASFFDNFKMFHIYNQNGNLVNETIMEIQDIFIGKERKSNLITYYHTVKATNEFIYALCLNEQSDNLLNYKPTLEIWNWEGNPVAAYTLDRDVFSFDVTDDNKYIYCMDRQTNDNIFVYSLNVTKN